MLFSQPLLLFHKTHLLCASRSFTMGRIAMLVTFMSVLESCGFVLVKSGGDSSNFGRTLLTTSSACDTFPSRDSSYRFFSFLDLSLSPFARGRTPSIFDLFQLWTFVNTLNTFSEHHCC